MGDEVDKKDVCDCWTIRELDGGGDCVGRTGTLSSYCGRYQVSVMGMAHSPIIRGKAQPVS